MKVLQVIAIFQKAAGTSVFCGEIAMRLRKLGEDVQIAVPDPDAEGLYPVLGVDLLRICDVLRSERRWDIVHIHGIWSPILHKVVRWARRNEIPIVWSPHGMLRRNALRMKRFKKLLGLIAYQWWDLRWASLIHVCSEQERMDLCRLHLNRPLVTIPLGIDVQDGAISPKRSGSGRLILYLGRINRGKGLIRLVDAWSRLRRPGWRVCIAGYNEGGVEEELRARVFQLGMSEMFDFPGPMYGAEKMDLMASADLFVLPSMSENFGSVVIEALSQRTPVIATKETPWSALRDNNCGWWIEGEVKSLAETLNIAMTLSDEERQTMGDRGRKMVLSEYSWSRVVKDVEKAYQTLC